MFGYNAGIFPLATKFSYTELIYFVLVTHWEEEKQEALIQEIFHQSVSNDPQSPILFKIKARDSCSNPQGVLKN